MRGRGPLMLGAALGLGVASGLGAATCSPLRAQEGKPVPGASGVTSGDMSSGTGGARPDAPAQGGVASRPAASAGQSFTPRGESGGGGTQPDGAAPPR
jgi:hypothetical protein